MSQFVRKQLSGITVCQYNIGAQLLVLIQEKINEKYSIHRFYIELPTLSLHTLTNNGMRKVIQSTFLEINLGAVLHLHNYFLTRVRGAEDVVDGNTLSRIDRQLLIVQKGKVGYHPFALQQII